VGSLSCGNSGDPSLSSISKSQSSFSSSSIESGDSKYLYTGVD
jgi:hypothetical protein